MCVLEHMHWGLEKGKLPWIHGKRPDVPPSDCCRDLLGPGVCQLGLESLPFSVSAALLMGDGCPFAK